MYGPRYAENLTEVVRRGGIVFSDTRLCAVRCTDCHCSFLLDETTGRLFLDAQDLRRTAAEDKAPPCPGCRRADWAFEAVPGDQLDDVVEGPWGFTFWRPPAVVRSASGSRKLAYTIVAGAILAVGVAALAMNPDPFAAPGNARPQVQVPAGR